MTRLAARLALVGLGGCSLIGVTGPPAQLPDHTPVECTHAPVLPIFDAALALAAIGFATTLVEEADGKQAPGVGLVVIATLPVGLVFLASGAYRASTVSRCMAAEKRVASAQKKID